MAYLQVTALPFGHGLPLFDDRASWMALAGMASTLGTVLAAASLRNHRAPAESVDPAPES